MDIIAESGTLIFKGRHALRSRHLIDPGKNCHFAGNLSNKHMLINFIHSSLKIAGFIGMAKKAPENTDPGDECTDPEDQSEQASVHEEEQEERDPDPLGLARFSDLSVSKKPDSPLIQPVPPAPIPGSSIASGDGSGMQVDASGDGSGVQEDTGAKAAPSIPSPGTPKASPTVAAAAAIGVAGPGMLGAAFAPVSSCTPLPSPEASTCIPLPSPEAIELPGMGAGGPG